MYYTKVTMYEESVSDIRPERRERDPTIEAKETYYRGKRALLTEAKKPSYL
jgi:hypothetical protein